MKIESDGRDDGSLISGLQAFESWQIDLNYPVGWRLGLLNASGYIAGFLAGPLIVWIDDTFGRRWGIRCELRPQSCSLHPLTLVYGVCVLVGTVIGSIAGISGIDGYSGMSPPDCPLESLSSQSSLLAGLYWVSGSLLI
jgi:SP family sugar:H+ symporter-like MFS transporter